MAPLKVKTIESLESLTLRAVLSSVIADLYLSHLLTQDLKDSFLLAPLRSKSSEELLKATAQRLQVLPGLLNDQVRDNLIKEFFSKLDVDKWPGIRLDILKVLLNETVTSLNLGARRIPREALAVIGSRCPKLVALQIFLDEPELSVLDVKSFAKVKVDEFESKGKDKGSPAGTNRGPARKRRKLSAKREVKIPPPPPSYALIGGPAAFHHLTEASIVHGATNELMAALGQNAPRLEKLHVCNSFSVTDMGVKNLCLKYPENHTQRADSHLHEMRVRSFHLNPCCSVLREIDTVGTCVSHFGVAFLLKYVPRLGSLGDCSSISEALEVLVGRRDCKGSTGHKDATLLPTIRRHTARYKLSRLKEVRVTSNKFLLLSSLCPELRELTLGHSFREIDLSLSLEALWPRNALRRQLGPLRHLKQLSLLNVGSESVRESLELLGPQLTHLHVFCKGLDLPTVLRACTNLTSLTLEGSFVSAPYESLESVRGDALRKLESVKLRSTLPSSYIELILSNSKRLAKIDMANVGDIGDRKIEELVLNGHFEHLSFLLVTKAPQLTIKSASILVHKCPRLADLRDLGGWNITCEQYYQLQNDVIKGNFDINLTYYGVISRDVDSDASSVASDYTSDLFNAFRNVFPIVII